MEDMVALVLSVIAVSQAGLCISLLTARVVRMPAYLPLMIFFVVIALVASGPVINTFMPYYQTHFMAFYLPSYLLFGPVLYLYVEALTAEQAWFFRREHLRHFVPALFGLIATIMIIAMPHTTREAIFLGGATEDMFIGPNDSLKYLGFVVIYIFLLIPVWLLQSGYYLIRIFRRLTQYRNRLKDLFSSNEDREMLWIYGLLGVVGSVWLVFFFAVISDNFFDYKLIGQHAGGFMSVLLIWSLAVWGLRQKPGFAGRYLDGEASVAVDDLVDDIAQQKYQRSALSSERAERIIQKIETGMAQDKLYLDANLSLLKLSTHIGVTPNYISQTLNERMETNFFDHVNKWRIEAAKPKVLEGDETILAIAFAVGFNARSSFYKAFKKETGQTPSDYRKNIRG